MKKTIVLISGILATTQILAGAMDRSTDDRGIPRTGYHKTSLRFSNYHTYLKYNNIKLVKGIDSARTYYLQQLLTGPDVLMVDYLPLAGGTLTGALAGTSATFSGNVGIGTSSPGSKLDVSGSFRVVDPGGSIGLKTLGTSYARLINTDVANPVNQAGISLNGFVNTSTGDLVQDNTGLPTWMALASADRDDYQIKRAAAGTTNPATMSILFAIKNSGNIGIGTSSPGSKLDVNGSFRVVDPGGSIALKTLGTSYARLINTDVANPVNQGGVSLNGYVNTSTGDLVQDNAALPTWMSVFSAERDDYQIKRAAAGTTNAATFNAVFAIKNNGRIGIGTTAPNTLLEVNGDMRNSSPLQWLYTNNIDVISPSVDAKLFDGTANAGVSIATGLTSGNVKIGPSTGGITVLGSASSGKVGIGTTSPNAPLEVNGNIRNTGTGQMFLTNNVDVLSPSVSANLFFSTQNATVAIASGLTSGNVSIGPAGGITVLGSAANGNVGIGTSDPGVYKLAVNGNIRAKKLIVETGWSDYVFNKEYPLRSLSSLERFIQQNKHLPDIPSAKEVEKNGVSVGENQALLLKKIEELTLYIIGQDKRILALEKKIKNKPDRDEKQ
jgi:hypothetical protein